jgi:hypothetical protein
MPPPTRPVFCRRSISAGPIATTGGRARTVKTIPGRRTVGAGVRFGTPVSGGVPVPKGGDVAGPGQSAPGTQSSTLPEGEVPDDDRRVSAPRPSAPSPQSDRADSAGGANTSGPLLDPIDASFTPTDNDTARPPIDVPNPATLFLLITGLVLMISRSVVTHAPRAAASRSNLTFGARASLLR